MVSIPQGKTQELTKKITAFHGEKSKIILKLRVTPWLLISSLNKSVLH